MSYVNTLLAIDAGELKTLRFPVTDADNADAPLDLTNYTVRFTLAKLDAATGKFKPVVVTKLSTTVGHMTINAASGLVDVHLKNADTAALLGEYEYRVRIQDLAGEWSPVAAGKLKINPGQ